MKPFYDKMMAALDPVTQVLTDEAAIPKCPNCGEEMWIHARLDRSFIDEEHDQELNRMNSWFESYKDSNILLLEFGAGFNTPMVIRYPFERIYKNLKDANFIRLNMDNAYIESASEATSISFQGDIKTWLDGVTR